MRGILTEVILSEKSCISTGNCLEIIRNDVTGLSWSGLRLEVLVVKPCEVS